MIRSETISISERNLMFVIGGQLFTQAPNKQPRKAEIIMQKVRDSFRKDAHNFNEHYSLRILPKETYNYLSNLLMSIPEFEELNLSQIEFEKNISTDDESRPKYSFSSAYDKYDSESWKSDFIDLEAFTKNVCNKLLAIIESDKDCFPCVHEQKDSCKNCALHPNLTYNFEGTRSPKGNYTFSCKYDCPKDYQICCEECNTKDRCTTKCDGESSTCGNVWSGTEKVLITLQPI